jgi:hypothetical protein
MHIEKSESQVLSQYLQKCGRNSHFNKRIILVGYANQDIAFRILKESALEANA